MLKHYTEFCWMFIGGYLVTKNWLSPYAGIVAGALILVLSIIAVVG